MPSRWLSASSRSRPPLRTRTCGVTLLGNVTLRPYQKEAVQAAWRAWGSGMRAILWVIATGCGKTIAFAYIACQVMRKGRRVLILAHREELLDQAYQRITHAAPWTKPYVAIEQAHRRASTDSRCVIASVQTLANQKRRKRFAMTGGFDLVIVDEAHHAAARTYRDILNAFPKAKVLGVTATPRRGDNVGLSEVFDGVCFHYGLRDGILGGYLADIRQFAIRTTVSLDDVSWRAGDFADGELADTIDTPERNRLVVEAYQRHGEGRKCLCFAVNVQHAVNLAEAFRDFDIAAEHASGAMGRKERRRVLKAFRAGEIQVLTNCALYTEGFDEPSVACLLMARPTGSPSLYEQMVGRGTRLAPGKKDLLVLDFMDNCMKHGLVSTPEILGLSLDELDGAEASGKVKESQEDQVRQAAAIKAYEAAPLAYKLAEVDPFNPRAIISLSDYVPEKDWHSDPITPAQINVLQQRGMSPGIIASLLKGEASHLISQVEVLEGWPWEERADETEVAERIELRKYAQRMAVRRDRRLGLADGTTNQLAVKRFGKSRKAMDVEELRQCVDWLERDCPDEAMEAVT
ncbi:MAG: DEAD/DEAH box helicase [Armatimonadia bacterium]|nr:DEAD/DEAH box helicase [Armatimonadia bacterium]